MMKTSMAQNMPRIRVAKQPIDETESLPKKTKDSKKFNEVRGHKSMRLDVPSTDSRNQVQLESEKVTLHETESGIKIKNKENNKELDLTLIEPESLKSDQLISEIEDLRELIEITAKSRNIDKLVFRPDKIKNWMPSEPTTETIEERREQSIRSLVKCQIDMTNFFEKLITDQLNEYTGIVFEIPVENTTNSNTIQDSNQNANPQTPVNSENQPKIAIQESDRINAATRQVVFEIPSENTTISNTIQDSNQNSNPKTQSNSKNQCQINNHSPSSSFNYENQTSIAIQDNDRMIAAARQVVFEIPMTNFIKNLITEQINTITQSNQNSNPSPPSPSDSENQTRIAIQDSDRIIAAAGQHARNNHDGGHFSDDGSWNYGEEIGQQEPVMSEAVKARFREENNTSMTFDEFKLKNVPGSKNILLTTKTKLKQIEWRKGKQRSIISLVAHLGKWIEAYGTRSLQNEVFGEMMKMLDGEFANKRNIAGIKRKTKYYEGLDYESMYKTGLDALAIRRQHDQDMDKLKQTDDQVQEYVDESNKKNRPEVQGLNPDHTERSCSELLDDRMKF